jgi:hypothetical protein
MELVKEIKDRFTVWFSARKLIRQPMSTIMLTIATTAMLVSLPAQASSLFRYINDKGYQEIGYSIPNHLVANGYDVIDERGRLIRRVAAQLSEEDYAAKLERERKLEACEKAMGRVQRRYEDFADIDAAERLFEKQLNESLRNDDANLESNYSQLSDAQERAARLERNGTTIPRSTLEIISLTEGEIQTLTAQIANQEQARVDKASEFDEERRLFQLGECNPDQLASLQ